MGPLLILLSQRDLTCLHGCWGLMQGMPSAAPCLSGVMSPSELSPQHLAPTSQTRTGVWLVEAAVRNLPQWAKA